MSRRQNQKDHPPRRQASLQVSAQPALQADSQMAAQKPARESLQVSAQNLARSQKADLPAANTKFYTTGKFARLGHVSERALRLYDRKGLLKPQINAANGYRMYKQEDLFVLQKILLFKKLGFSLEEIGFLLIDEGADVVEALQAQKQLVERKIAEYQAIVDAISDAVQLAGSKRSDPLWPLQLLDVLDEEGKLVEQYKDASNLAIRMDLHARYSRNPQGWFEWVYEQLDLSDVRRMLDAGCGSGRLWLHHEEDWHERELYLADLSKGMLEDASRLLANPDISYLNFDLAKIPFRNQYFDAVVAAHVLFYMEDVPGTLQEICRVLRQDGTLYATCYGSRHMQEISELAREFDPAIRLSAIPLWEVFGLENGRQLLEPYFREVRLVEYPDALEVTEPKDLAAYILSCHGNQNEILLDRYDEFLSFLAEKMKNNPFHITKQAGMWIARYPCLP